LRTKEQETRLTLHERNDDDDDVLSSVPNHGVLRPDGMTFIVLIKYQMVILHTSFPYVLVILISVSVLVNSK
jgi:hypothetical protein